MAKYIDSCLILLTYKGKILLLQRDDILNQISQNAWHFIEKLKEKNKTLEETITQEVEREIHVKPEGVNLLMSVVHNERTENLFHAKLTDKNVNNIQRGGENLLQFFSFSELKKLLLQSSTKMMVSEYTSVIEKLSFN